MKKILISLSCIMLPLVVMLIVFFNEMDWFIYPKCREFVFGKWLFVYLVLLTFVLTIWYVIKNFKRKAIVSILLLFTIVPQLIIDAVVITFFMGTNWQSSTQDVGNYGKIDSDFDGFFEICELKFSDIMEITPLNVNEYDYTYRYEFGAVVFDVSFEIELAEENYNYLKDIFQENMSLEQNSENSGKYTITKDTPTSVDKWYEMYILFDDSTNTYSMKFNGECYT